METPLPLPLQRRWVAVPAVIVAKCGKCFVKRCESVFEKAQGVKGKVVREAQAVQVAEEVKEALTRREVPVGDGSDVSSR